MTGAMYAAVSGLKSHMNALNVIGNNIANVNTDAYKASRYTFLESLYTTVSSGSNGTSQAGGKNPAQTGYGSTIGTIDMDMSTKNYSPTGCDTDCMIDGDGFFLVGDKGTSVTTNDELKSLDLTRLGNFSFDNSGYLVDGQGKVVYGFLQAADSGGSTTSVSPSLTAIRLPMASDGKSGTAAGTPVFPTASDTGEVVDASTGVNGRIMQDSLGIDEKSGQITCTTTDGKTVVVGYIAIGKVDNPAGVTHVDGHYYQALEGAGSVHLTSIGGAVAGTDKSPIAIISSGNTKLITGGLESSGTDLATEITNMITIQRGYQANTRIVTVTDSMLEELVNMKR